MKLPSFLTITAAALFLALNVSAGANPAGDKAGARARREDDEQTLVRTLAADAGVVVSLCVASGDVSVRGWDKREISVRADVGHLELRAEGQQTGTANLTGAAPPLPPQPAARRVTVLMSDSEDEEVSEGDCSASGNVELEVPRGATLRLQLRSGDVDVTDVAEVYVESASGDTDLRRISRAIEVESMSGSIQLDDSSGSVRLRAFSGDVEAFNVRTISARDQFFAKSTSGNVSLDRVAHARVEAGTVSGDVSLSGALARGGSYDLQTFSGDVTLNLPPDVSFKVNAKVAMGGEILTDFQVKPASGVPASKEIEQGRLTGTVGTGDAELNLSSFNGTLRLRKRIQGSR